MSKNTNNYINRNIIRPIEQQESEENTNHIRQNEEPEIVGNIRFNPNPTNIINNNMINITNSQPNRPILKKIVKKINDF